jgi:hypothetical protein
MLHKIEMNVRMKKEMDSYLDNEFFDAKVGRLVGVGLRVVVHEHSDVYILNETIDRRSLRGCSTRCRCKCLPLASQRRDSGCVVRRSGGMQVKRKGWATYKGGSKCSGSLGGGLRSRTSRHSGLGSLSTRINVEVRPRCVKLG